MTTTAYSYVRFSSKEQAKGDSLRRQLASTRDACVKNGWQLDESLTPDQGISAWKGKNLESGSLSKFMYMVEAGTIPAGSVLVVEALDRISRQKTNIALATMLRIINPGFEIFTTMDSQRYYAGMPNLEMMLMQMILKLGMASEESEKKSKRSLANWENKKKLASVKPMTGKTPKWIRLNDAGKLELIPAAVKTIKTMVEYSKNGMGALAIAKKLNADNVPPMGRGKAWDFGTVRFTLISRKLIGEFQSLSAGKPVGNPIPNYFPAVLTEPEFYELQAALNSRKANVRGRSGNSAKNIFAGITYSIDGSKMTMHYMTGQNRKNKHILRSTNSVNGSSEYASFPYDIFETAFIGWINEIKLRSQNASASCPVDVAELAKIDGTLNALQADIESGDASATVLKAVKNLEKKKAVIQQQLEAWKMQQSKTAAPSGTSIAALLKKNPDDNEIRVKVRTAIQSLVSKITMDVVKTGSLKICKTDVEFGTGEHRHFCVVVARAGSRGLTSESFGYDSDADLNRQISALIDAERTM